MMSPELQPSAERGMRWSGLLLLLCGLALASCGKPGKSSADLSGTGKKAAVSGEVTGFGSIIVNGTRYATDQATITLDGAAATETDLAVGMRVELRFDDVGQLTEVLFRSNVRGPVAAVAADGRSLSVLGQAIRIDELTVLDGVSTDMLSDRTLQISASTDADGTLRASYLAPASGNAETVQLTGAVADLDRARQQFRINAQGVDFSALALLDVPDGMLSDGLPVRVEGLLRGSDGVLLANQIVALNPLLGAEAGALVEIGGLIQSLQADQLSVEGVRVDLLAATQYLQGVREDLRAGLYVDVVGELAESGVLAAQALRLRPPVDAEFAGDIEAIDTQTETVFLLGGTEIVLAANVRLRDLLPTGNRNLRLEDLRVGDRVQISGFTLADGTIVGIRLEREPPPSDGRVSLRGPVTRLDAGQQQFFIRDTLVMVSADTAFEGYADAPAFFAEAGPGQQHTVDGQFSAGADSSALVADRIARVVMPLEPPGQNQTPPGQDNDPPGQGNNPPGQDQTPPGQGNDPPGQGNNPPGQDQTPPGQDNDPPGQGNNPPGQDQTPPGQDNDPPGQGNNPPGQDQTPPGQDNDPPGQDQTPPGQDNDPPGQGNNPPGQGNNPPGQGRG